MQADAGFWRLYVGERDSELDSKIAGADSASWIATVRSLAEGDNHLSTAVRALAFTGLGWMRDETPLVQHGLRLYSRALRETNILLQNPVAARSDTVLACCRVLSVFEMFRRTPQSTSGENPVLDWQSHIDGVCRLIQLRGPDGLASRDGLRLFDATRATAIFYGIGRRQANAFTSLTWDVPRQRSLRDYLFEVMSMVPALYGWTDRCNAQLSATNGPDEAVTAVNDCRECIKYALSICHLLRGWETKAINTCKQQHGAVGSVEAWLSGSSLFDFSTQLSDDFFYLCTQYWATGLKVYNEVRQLDQRVRSVLASHATSDSPLEIPEWIDAEDPAHRLARTSSYFFRPGSGLWAAQSAVFPLGAALFYFARSGRADAPVFLHMLKSFENNPTGRVMRDFVRNIVFDCKQF